MQSAPRAYPWLQGLSARFVLLVLLLSISAPTLAGKALNEARSLFQKGQPERALHILNGIPDNAEDGISARLLRGVIQAELGQMDQAISTFELLSRDFPQIPQPLNNLAVIYAERGMTEQARSTLLRAIELQPRHANAHHNLGDLYIHMAVEAYSNAYELDPNNALLTRKLARAGNLVDGEDEPTQVASNGSAPPFESFRAPSKEQVLAEVEERTVTPIPPPPKPSNTTNTRTAAVTPPATVSEPNPVSALPPNQAPAWVDSPQTEPAPVLAQAQPEPAPVSAPVPVEERHPTPAPIPKPSPAPTDASTASGPDRCLAIGPIRGSGTRSSVRKWLRNQGLKSAAIKRDKPIGIIYQVYIPPTGSYAAAKAKIANLKSKGIRDAVSIRTGVLKTGVSLGAFKDEAGAEKLIKRLQRKGFTAKHRTQNPVHKQTWLVLRSDTDSGQREAILSEFPNLRMQAGSCE